MLLSMTGFGEALVQQGPLSVTVEVRTINNRYFKLTVRSSEAYLALESHTEAVVRNYMKRGTVMVDVRVERASPAEEFRINAAVLEGYRQQLVKLFKQWDIQRPVQVERLLVLPGVVEDQAARRADLARDWPTIEAALHEAMEKLARMRAEEGAALAADLTANSQRVEAELAAIEARLPDVAEDYRQRLADRVGKALERHGMALAPADLIREVSLFAERSDVAEEMVRLRSHLEQFGATLALEESSGRKLDFITQEMFREANTIGSKSNDVRIATHVVEIKAAVERMREQVQNIE